MKPLPRENYIVRPFKVYKTHSYPYSYLGATNSSRITIDEAVAPVDIWQQFNPSTSPINPDGIYKNTLYESLEQLFYPPRSASEGSGSSRFLPMFQQGFDPGLLVYVINISQQAFGEKVYPESFTMSTPSSTASFYDDGGGKIVSSLDPTKVVGNIFYQSGIAVIQQSTGSLSSSVINQEGLYLTTGSSVVVGFQSQVTLYEHIIIMTLEKGELNYSTNPSLQLNVSSSVSGSEPLFSAMLSGTLTPYITTLAGYNSRGEMMVIGKVPRAIRRTPEMEQSFIIKFDV